VQFRGACQQPRKLIRMATEKHNLIVVSYVKQIIKRKRKKLTCIRLRVGDTSCNSEFIDPVHDMWWKKDAIGERLVICAIYGGHLTSYCRNRPPSMIWDFINRLCAFLDFSSIIWHGLLCFFASLALYRVSVRDYASLREAKRFLLVTSIWVYSISLPVRWIICFN
jgi:hypothetical protein